MLGLFAFMIETDRRRRLVWFQHNTKVLNRIGNKSVDTDSPVVPRPVWLVNRPNKYAIARRFKGFDIRRF